MATFGFSVGDFIAFLGVVKDVTAALKESTGSASSYRSLIQTLEALNQALTTSGLIYLQWESIPVAEGYKKESQAMINGMLFHRQQCKELIEGFVGSTHLYQNAFLESFQGPRHAMTKNMRKITWMFQKDKILQLEKDLQSHLTAVRIYSDGLFQSQMNANAVGLNSNVERILSTITNVQADTSLISTTLQAWQRPVMSNLGYTWEDTSSLAQNVLLLDAIGRNISLPLMFVSSPNVFHDLLFIMFRGIPGGKKIMRREYALTEGGEGANIIEESNWGTLVRPGMKMSLHMILRASSSWDTNHCPKCNEATFGPSLPGKRARCPKCQFTYSVFEHERLVEAKEGSFTRPTIEEGDVFFKSNRKLSSNRGVPWPLSRTRLSQKKLVFSEESYFKRVHFHREIPKLVSGSAPGFNALTRMKLVEDTLPLQIDSLPPLHKAAAQGQQDKIAQLLDDGEDIDSSFFSAVHLEKDGRRCEFEGCTPLQIASWYGQLKSITILLDLGADINKRSSDGKQALAFAVLGEGPGVATLLLRRGADINNRDEDHQTAFHEACSRSNAVLVHLLLDYGAELEAKTKRRGRTALHVASSRGVEDVVKALLAHDADVAAQDENGETPLHRASWNKHASIVRTLLERGVDTEIQTKRGYTALHNACSVGCDLVVNILLEHGANVEAQAGHGSTALHEAATGGFIITVQTIVDRGANMEIQNAWGRTPLHEAALNGHLEVVKYLIQKGASVLCQDQTGNTPLHSACLQNTHRNVEELVQILISTDPAAIATQNKDGETPLHLACHAENLNIVRLVMDNSNENLVAAQNNNGETPLYIAASCGYTSIVQLLLETNPSANTLQSTTGRTPLYVSCCCGFPETAKILLKADPALVNVKSSGGSTPLHEAAAKGISSTVDLLLENGAEINAQNDDKNTPLHFACINGNNEVAIQLLAQGADINIPSSDGFLAIHSAASSGMDEFLKILLQRGQDPSAKTVIGFTPLHSAACGGHGEVTRILIDAGADIGATASPLCFAPLHFAASEGHGEVTRILIDAGADIEVTATPLCLAPIHIRVVECHSEDIRILAEADANLDRRSALFGLTPLQMAETTEIVQLLLELGADPEVPMTCGLTNEEMAILRGQVDIAKLYTERSGNECAITKTRDSGFIKKLWALREEYSKLVTQLEEWENAKFSQPVWEEEILGAEQYVKDWGDLLNSMNDTSPSTEGRIYELIEDLFRRML